MEWVLFFMAPLALKRTNRESLAMRMARMNGGVISAKWAAFCAISRHRAAPPKAT